MSRKLPLSAFCTGNGVLESTTRRIAGSTQRTFSSSARRNANMGQFTPASTPELNELLSTIRRKIILPAYLPLDQRKKIFSQKYEAKLRTDPVVIEIDGEVIRFRYQNPFTDMPQTRRSIINAISLFQTPEDYANLRPLLEGIAYAKRHFDPSFYCKILRVLGNAGRIYDIIEYARGVSRTGFHINSSEMANETMHFIQLKAIDAAWDRNQTARALRWAEMVLELLHEDAHQPKRRKDERPLEGELPLYRDPMILLAPLHLAAELVARQGSSVEVEPQGEAEGETEGEVKAEVKGIKDEDAREKLAKYARDIVRLWPEGKNLTEVQPWQLYKDYNKMGYLLEPNKFGVLATPLLHGLETAITVVEPELAAQLQSRRDLLAAEVQEARQKDAVAAEIRKERRKAAGLPNWDAQSRWVSVYQKLYENTA